MALTKMQVRAHRMFAQKVQKSGGLEKVAEALKKAHMPVRSEAWVSQAMLYGFIAVPVSFVIGAILAFGLTAFLDFGGIVWLIPLVLPPLAGYVTYAAVVSTPASNAKKRAKDMELRLPYATNYIAAMASAGVIPAEIWRSLSRQQIYGEVAKEAAMIFKDLEVHGIDIINALRRSIARCPSVRFQELLQGSITTIISGGDLTAYYRQKATRYQWENRVEQKSFIETMGLMAETYVTAAVAGPLFLLVMVAIIVLMGSGQMSQLQLIVYLLLPVINIGFMFGVKAMIPEV